MTTYDRPASDMFADSLLRSVILCSSLSFACLLCLSSTPYYCRLLNLSLFCLVPCLSFTTHRVGHCTGHSLPASNTLFLMTTRGLRWYSCKPTRSGIRIE